MVTHNPLSPIPAEVADLLRPHIPSIVDEMMAEIQLRVAEYARPEDAQYSQVMRMAIEHALEAFLDRIGRDDAPTEELHQVFQTVGAGEATEGRSLDSLQTALRSGTLVAWRRLNKMSGPAQIDSEHIMLLAEAMFLFLDEIAGAATAGYSRAQAKVVGELQRRRTRLVNLLLSEEAVSHEAIADLARAAQWRLPSDIAVIVLRGRDAEQAGLPPLPQDVLVDANRLDPCLVVPDLDGPGRPQLLERSLRGWDAAVGPTVPVAGAANSLSRAKEALALMRSSVISTTGLARWDEHLVTLLLFADEEIIRALSRSRLAPLRELRPAQRDRLAETLLVWLQVGYNANEVAARLHVHPQTVRYRLRQLETLFGDQLRDPDRRFELEMVLRVRSLNAVVDAEAGAGGADPIDTAGQSRTEM